MKLSYNRTAYSYAVLDRIAEFPLLAILSRLAIQRRLFRVKPRFAVVTA